MATNGNAVSWDLDSFYSTSHIANIKSNTSKLEVKWEATENDNWFGYWYAFSEGSAITINDDYEGDYDEISARTMGIWENSWTKSTQINDSGTTSYYFNLSVVDSEGDPHPVTSIGPFFIDTEPPGSPRFVVPETTTSANIIITDIGATDAVQFCISNSGFDVCTWENLTGSQRLWSVNNELNAQTTIYMQFKDDVGNISTASATTTYTETTETTVNIPGVRAIPTLTHWGCLIFSVILILSALLCYWRRPLKGLSR